MKNSGFHPSHRFPFPNIFSRYLGINFRMLCNSCSSSDLFLKNLERSKISKIPSYLTLHSFGSTQQKLLSPIDCLVHVRYGIGCRFDSMVHHSEMSEARQVTVRSHQFGDTVALHSSSPKLLRNNGRNGAVNNMESQAGIRGEGGNRPRTRFRDTQK